MTISGCVIKIKVTGTPKRIYQYELRKHGPLACLIKSKKEKFQLAFQFQLWEAGAYCGVANSWSKSSESTILWYVRFLFLSFIVVRCEKRTNVNAFMFSLHSWNVRRPLSKPFTSPSERAQPRVALLFAPNLQFVRRNLSSTSVRPNFMFSKWHRPHKLWSSPWHSILTATSLWNGGGAVASWASPDHIWHGVIEQSLANQPLRAALACAGRPCWASGLWGLAKGTATNSAKLKA